jgi:hypothetical protein
MKPVVADGEELSEEQLEAVAGGFCIKSIASTVWNGIKSCGC